MHMATCLFLQADEAVSAGDKHAEGRLKGLVTSTVEMIEAKGVDPVKVDNHLRLMMTSNSDWVVPAGKDERRFAIFDVGRTAHNVMNISPRCCARWTPVAGSGSYTNCSPSI